MRGYTAKKGNRYYAVIYEGVDPATGKEHRRWYPAGTRRGDAEKLVTELVKRMNDGAYRPPEKTTLASYLTNKWLPAQRSQLRPSTFDSYRRTIELHVLPAIGNVPLAKLAPEDLDALYARLLESGRRNASGAGAGLSPTSVRYVHRIVRKALGDALRKGTIPRNPATLADPPKAGAREEPGKQMRVWTAAQLQSFLKHAGPERLGPAYFLAANTGMRRGEVLGLRWDDVDLASKRIHVCQAITSVAYHLRIADVKTNAARRTIDIDGPVVRVLQAWRRRLAEERLLVGPAYEDGRLVFPRPDGSPIHPELFSRTFDRLVAGAGLPAIRLHDLRHTHATLLLKAGVPAKVVSERLGHASPGFTLNVYQWVLPGMQAEAAATFSRLLSADPVEDPVEVEGPVPSPATASSG
ncbi:MAG: tyrosine-type recombinase/integrase [Acidimicrobiia bacterium]